MPQTWELVEPKFETEALIWPERAKAITIRDQKTYELATAFLLDIASLEKQITDHHAPVKAAAFAAHKAAVAAEKRLLDPLTDAKAIIKRSIADWTIEQERIRREAQRKAEEEARIREEAERLALAVQAEELGAEPEAVEHILSTPAQTMAHVVAPTFQKAAGVSTRKVWKWRVVDEVKIPRAYMVIDTVKINGVVRAMGPTVNIPGIQVYEDTTVSARRGA